MADRFDLDAIDADDALLDLLAAGGESARSAGEYDPAVKLLADLRLAVEVEDELPVETIDDPESFLARCAALNPVMDPFARKMAARGLALGVAAVAALSVSGVAAAVNGDPLSPYEKVIEKMVDAVSPQTSFPKEQLDGMPVVDRSKIVKVAKNYKDQQVEKAEAQEKRVQTDPIPPASVLLPKDQQDILQRAMPKIPEQPTVTELETTDPPATTLPEKTGDDPTTTEPTDPPTTTEPTDPTTTEPPATTPTDPPTTTEPTEPTTTEPPATTPTDPPTTGTGNTETGTETGDTGTGNPTTAPTGSGDKGDTTETGSDTIPTTLPSDTGGTDQSGDETTPADPAQDPLTDLVDKILQPILPTPSGDPVELKSAEEFFGEALTPAAKHSSGKVTSGSVKQTYPTGKHSTGQYAEGKHAAIARTHGSTEDAPILTILGVVNTPTAQ